jgi:hypothetical protein
MGCSWEIGRITPESALFREQSAACDARLYLWTRAFLAEAGARRSSPGVSRRITNNHAPRVRRVYVGQQFANPAIPAAPLTFYAPSGPRLQQPSYLAPQLPPTADKSQQAQALASAIQRIRTLHHQDFPAMQKLVVPYPPRPDHAVILRRRMNDALERVSIFRRSTRKAAKAAAVLATQMECNELEAASQAQYVAVQQEIDELWQRLRTNDPDVLLAVLSHAFQNSGAQAAPLGVCGMQKFSWRFRARSSHSAGAASHDHRGGQPLPQKVHQGGDGRSVQAARGGSCSRNS